MKHDNYDEAYIRAILNETKTIAVVGASANPVRPSYFVVKYLIDKGYTVFPVNPREAGKTICGALAYASLGDISVPIHMVDIFRAAEAVPGIVDEALTLAPLPNTIWMQLGVRHQEAAKKAEAAGIQVVMNRCPKIEYGRLSGEIGWTGVNRRLISSKKPQMRAGFQHFGIRRT